MCSFGRLAVLSGIVERIDVGDVLRPAPQADGLEQPAQAIGRALVEIEIVSADRPRRARTSPRAAPIASSGPQPAG